MAFFPTPLLFKDEVYAITGAAMEVLNTLGNGLNEKVYENALVVECRLRRIPFDQQPRFPVDYKGCRVGEFIPDLILHGKIIVDTKTIDRITDVDAVPDAELPAGHRVAAGNHHQLQACQVGSETGYSGIRVEPRMNANRRESIKPPNFRRGFPLPRISVYSRSFAVNLHF